MLGTIWQGVLVLVFEDLLLKLREGRPHGFVPLINLFPLAVDAELLITFWSFFYAVNLLLHQIFKNSIQCVILMMI